MDPDFKILIKQKLQKISEFFAAIKLRKNFLPTFPGLVLFTERYRYQCFASLFQYFTERDRLIYYRIDQNLFLISLLKMLKLRRCVGLVVRVLASKSPVPGSNLGPEPPHSVV